MNDTLRRTLGANPWITRAARLAGLIVATALAGAILAGALPALLSGPSRGVAQAQSSLLPWTVGAFMLFALVRAALALRSVDHDLTHAPAGPFIVISALLDALFQLGLTSVVLLAPVAAFAAQPHAWSVAFAALGGLITGAVQRYLFNPHPRQSWVWLAGSALGWLITAVITGGGAT